MKNDWLAGTMALHAPTAGGERARGFRRMTLLAVMLLAGIASSFVVAPSQAIAQNPPKATTEAATSIKATQATLNAAVNAEGLATFCYFEYGPTTSYGSKAPSSPIWIGSGTSAIAFNGTPTGLSPGTLYHYRIVALSSAGTTKGEDKVFTTNARLTFASVIGSNGSGNGQFESAMDVAVDSAGNFWVAELHRVQKFNSKGEYLSQFGSGGAGNGQFEYLTSIALDSEGNIWTLDRGVWPKNLTRVQKFNSNGEYQSQFGSYGTGNGQFREPQGIAVDPSGNVWIADTENNRIEEFNSKGEYLRKAGSSGSGDGQFGYVDGIATDSEGAVWTVDGSRSRVQKFNSKGEYQSQFGSYGTGNGQFNWPSDISIDSQDNLWVLEGSGGRVQGFNSKGEYLTQFGSNGFGAGRFRSPRGIAAGSHHEIYVAESGRIQKLLMPPAAPSAITQEVTSLHAKAATLNATVTPDGLNTSYQFEYGKTTAYGSILPSPGKALGSATGAVAVEEDLTGLEANTTYHYRVVASNEQGTTYGLDRTFKTSVEPYGYARAFGSNGTGIGEFADPNGLTVDSSGDIWVIDSGNPWLPDPNRIEKFNSKGEYLTQVGSPGSANGQFGHPSSIAADPSQNIWVADLQNHRIQEFGPTGQYLRKIELEPSFEEEEEEEIWPVWPVPALNTDAAGNLWMADATSEQVRKFSPTGQVLSEFSTSGHVTSAVGISLDADGNVWIADRASHIVKFNSKGEYQSQFGSYGTGNGQFKELSGMDVDAEGNIWVSDTENNRIQEFSSTGTYQRQFGSYGYATGQLDAPSGLALDPEGDVWVADKNNSRVQEWKRQLPSAVTNQSGPGEEEEPPHILNATIDPRGRETVYQFEYGTTTSYGSKAPLSPASAGSGDANVEVGVDPEGIESGVTYHYRVVATNDAGTSYGKDVVIAAAPKATTQEATDVSATEATVNATVDPNGAATTYYFEYGTDTSYGKKVPVTPEEIGSGQGGVSVSKQINGLTEGSTYHYRVVASNEGGVKYGSDLVVSTPHLPTAITEGVENVTANEAVVTGQVNGNGEPNATYSFEYGPTSTYGMTGAFAVESAGPEGEKENAIDPLVNLAPETTYHYRVVAETEAGTVPGPDKTFTTTASSFSAQWEAEQAQEELSYTGKLDGGLPPEFMGMMWSDPAKIRNSGIMNAVKYSGAKMYRVSIHPSQFSDAELDEIFQLAANRGVRILPYFYPGTAPDVAFWSDYIKRTVERLGPGGTYWAGNGGAADRAPQVWEIGNEPNLATNWSGGLIKPAEYGNSFASFSAAAKLGAEHRGQSIDVLMSGLFATKDTACTQAGCTEVSGPDFIEKMGHYDSYDGVSFHPYVLKVNGSKPTSGTVDEATRKVKGEIVLVRNQLDALRAAQEKAVGHSLANKDIWITELGFPQGGDSDYAVSENVQKELIESTFNMIKANHTGLRIPHLFYYNIQDASGSEAWDHHSGLRKVSGKKRLAWGAYALQAGGDPNWPHPPTTKKRPALHLRPSEGILPAGLDNDGSDTQGHFDYWETNSGPNPTVFEAALGPIQGVEGEQEIQRQVTGLSPNTTYAYHPVVTNEEETTVVGENETFTTPPSSSTGTNVKRVLHGQAGWVWIDGWVKEGDIEGSLSGLSNVHVHIKLFRNGVFQRLVDVVTDNQGHYDSGYIEVGHGEWEVASEFPGGDGWNASETPVRKTFYVHDGVEIIAKHSGKCMDVEGAWTADGVPVMHGTCNGGSNQVFTLRPKDGGTSLELIARHSGKCVDVSGASTNNGAAIIQYGCHGGYNQAFREDWIPNTDYTKYVAVHSQKCLDVTGGSTEWAPFQQWECNGNAQQAFRLQPVESGPIPTETTITMDQELHGSPGWMTFHGRLDAGAYSMASRVVHVEFDDRTKPGWDDDGGHFTFPVDGNNFYAKADAELKPGYWTMRARFMGADGFAYSESAGHDLLIRRGNHFVNRYSDMCLSLSEGWKNFNGQRFIQWPCSGSPSGGDGQVFSFWPQGNGYYNIIPNGKNRCLDVVGGSTANHAELQQWDCGSAYWQQFDIVPITGQSPWVAFIARHSSKCVDNTGPSTVAGAYVFQQYDCNWTGGQQWRIDWVIFP